ncbi:MAG: coenzyme F420-0:L-glutamate ligase [Candidatus Falkowbacteria bacterium]
MPNAGKQLTITVDNTQYQRIPVKTHVITKDDDIVDIVEKYVAQLLEPNDILFISEKIVAISQGRAFPIAEIQPSKLAKFLVKFVRKSPYGIGLGSPWTMELAIREAGIFRMLFAAFLSAITKPFGMRGVFYKVVGKNINAIDGPCDYTLPPYNKYAKLGPKNPDKVAKQIKEKFGCDVIIIDANDIGVNVLGKSNQQISDEFCAAVFKDNPLGQTNEQTPIGIVRKI